MKMKNKANMWRVLVAASFTASVALAQDGIADDELLKLLDGAITNEVDVAAVEPEAQPEVVVPEKVEAPEIVSEGVSDAVSLEEILVDSMVKDADPVEEAEEGEVVDLGMDALEGGVADPSGELISVRLNEVGLEKAINLFAQLSGANIIVPDLVEDAQISVTLEDVEWRPALQSILDAYNYELYQKVAGSNVFSVRRRPVGAPEPQVVETFKLKYATVPNVAKLLRTLLPDDAKISEFASRNMIVVKSSESSLGEVRSVLATIDIVRQQVFIESKFMELSDGAQLDLGIDWQMLQSYNVKAADMSSTFTDGNNTGRNTDRRYDMNGNQVEAAGPPSFIENENTGVFERYQEIFPSVTKTSEKTLNRVSTAILSADDFSLVLGALEEDRGVSVVSNPKIIVANEQKANISIIRKEPNLKQEREQQMNDQPSTTTYTLDPDLKFFEYGIKLDVTPSINTSSNITVNIKPSLTRKYGDKAAGENTYPIIDEKTVETVFNLASGQTAAIGGLTEVTDSEIERKVPLLGSIPFLGRLFSWKQTVSGQTETIIFVTVELANTQDINLEDSLPEDSELARRRLIRDRNKKTLREHGRKYYEVEDNDKREDSMKEIDIQENKRVEKRANQTTVISN